MRRRLLVAVGTVIMCVAASSTPMRGQTAPAAPAAGGELVPFWLVVPRYPPLAEAARVHGVVIVALMVGADGRLESTTIERDVPLLTKGAVEAAKDSGFICRRCTGPMAYRLTYDFRLADSIEEVEAARAVISSTSGTLPIVAAPRIIDVTVSELRSRSPRPLEHSEQEP